MPGVSVDHTLLYGLITVVIVQLAGVATLAVNGWSARQQAREAADRLDARAIRDREWALEDRVSLAALHQAVQENTLLTAEGVRQAERAYQEANHVNTKISDLNAQLLRTKNGPTIQ